MSDFTSFPQEDAYESQIVGELPQSQTTPFNLEVKKAPLFTLSSGTVDYIVDAGTSKAERLRITAISGTTLTVGTRGLPQFSGGASQNFPHGGGASIIMSNPHSAFEDIATAIATKVGVEENNTFTGDNTHSGIEDFDGELNIPIYADATARDAAITSPREGSAVKLTTEGIITDYLGGVWVTRAADTTANASETVAGRVELATSAEFDAGTDVGGTGASLSVLPSQVPATSTEIGQLSGTTNIGEANTFFGATDMTGAEAETLTDGSDAGALHFHANPVVTGTFNPTGNGQTSVNAHGLGRTPNLVTIKWTTTAGAAGLEFINFGDIYYDGTTQTNRQIYSVTAGNTSGFVGTGVAFVRLNGVIQYSFAVTMDATNVTLTSSAHSNNNSISFTIKAE